LLHIGARRLVASRRFPACTLISAAVLHSNSILQLLLNAGAKADKLSCTACGPSRLTALHCAVARGTLRSITALLKAGASVCVRDSAGRTPLWYLSNRRHRRSVHDDLYAKTQRKELAEILRLFVAAGADVNAKKTKTSLSMHDGYAGDGNAGTTLLHIAAARGDVQLVKALLDLGADATATCKQGKTVLQCAAGTAVLPMVQQHVQWATSLRKQWLVQCLGAHVVNKNKF
jgi:ankyrin repeat protein